MTVSNKRKAIVSINKSIGILQKVGCMLEKDEYCIDVVQQSLAAVGLIKSANSIIIESHLRTCFRDALVSKDEIKQEEIINELIGLNKVGSKA